MPRERVCSHEAAWRVHARADAPSVRVPRVRTDQQDVEGKSPTEFFPGSDEEMAEFESDAKAKVSPPLRPHTP